MTVALALQLAGLACLAVSYALICRYYGRSQRAAGRKEAEEEHRSRIGALVGSATFMPTFTPYDEEAFRLHERLQQLRLIHIKQAYRDEIHRIESGEGVAILNRMADGGDQ